MSDHKKPRRDKGGKLQPGKTFINPVTGMDVKWSVDPGPKYYQHLGISGPENPTDDHGMLIDAIRENVLFGGTWPGVAGRTMAQHDTVVNPVNWGPNLDGKGWEPRYWMASCTGCFWTYTGQLRTPVEDMAQAHHDHYHPSSTVEIDIVPEIPPRKRKIMKHSTSYETSTSEDGQQQTFVGTCDTCDWIRYSKSLSRLNEMGLSHTRRHLTEEPEPEEQPKAESKPKGFRDEYTTVEILEVMPEGVHPDDLPMVKFNTVMINGSPVRVAQDGITIDYNSDDKGHLFRATNTVRVMVELLVDEFSIRRVRHDYGTDRKPVIEMNTGPGGHLHFEAVHPATAAQLRNQRRRKDQD